MTTPAVLDCPRLSEPICDLPWNHRGPCKWRSVTVDEARHLGETVDGIRELAIIDRYYAQVDLSEAGLPV